MNTATYRITAFDADDNMLYLTEPDVRPSADQEMHFEVETARQALEFVAVAMPAYSYSYDPATDDYGFVPAFISYYHLHVPHAMSLAHAEVHVPTSSSHAFCTHARTSKGRAACRKARRTA
jgi:hypothetical protein